MAERKGKRADLYDAAAMGRRIARRLTAKGWSQSDLSRIMAVSKMAVSQWCDGSEPNPVDLTIIAHLLFDGDVMYLVYGASRKPIGGFPPHYLSVSYRGEDDDDNGGDPDKSAAKNESQRA